VQQAEEDEDDSQGFLHLRVFLDLDLASTDEAFKECGI
jgi:hypothetical protein